MNCVKYGLCCPAVSVGVLDDLDAIVIGVSQCVEVVRGGDRCLLDVLSSHCIHGISHSTGGRVLVYGWKLLAIIQVDRDIHKSRVDRVLDPLSDFILDAREVPNTHTHTDTHDSLSGVILVGFAQNYISGIDMKSGDILFSCQQESLCVLFSMSIHAVSHSDVSVASGTAFGKIILWHLELDRGYSSAKKVTTARTLEGHTGVICRIRWNCDRRYIASVSDDRSVRVWDLSSPNVSAGSGSCVFVGWGHVCRVWDVLFVGKDEEYIVTSSEDATLKLWRWKHSSDSIDTGRGCIATLTGHANKHVWRISAVEKGVGVENTVVISAGNDGSVKSWPLGVHMVLSRSASATTDAIQHQHEGDTGVYSNSSPVPPWNTAMGEQSKCDFPPSQSAHRIPPKSRRDNGAAGVRVSPDGSVAVVALLDGGVWLVKLHHTAEWCQVCKVGQGVGISGMDATWVGGKVVTVCVHPNGLATTISFQYDTVQDSVIVHQCFVVRVHETKGISVWIIHADSSSCRVVTSTVGGVCNIWDLCHSGSGEAPASELSRQVTSLRTVRDNIATCSRLIGDGRHLIIGDCRGNLSLYTDFDISPSSHPSHPISPSLCVIKAHSLEVVSYIYPIENASSEISFCSLGYDGFINTYTIINCVTTSGDPKPAVRLVSRLSCLPITSPDEMCVFGSGERMSVYIAGYQASEYVVWDMRRKYTVLRVEAGGWKRPHRCVIRPELDRFNTEMDHLPGVSFVFLAPLNKNTSFTYIRYDPHDSKKLTYPLHYGIPSHGRVAYCSAMLPSPNRSCPLVAVGGEDGTVKVFSFSRDSTASPSHHLHHPKFLQEVQMPSSSSVRAMAFSPDRSQASQRGIVIGAGGRLSYSVWRYDMCDRKGPFDFPIGCMLQPLCSSAPEVTSRRHNNKKASKSTSIDTDIEGTVTAPRISSLDAQDHRILAVSGCSLSSTVTLCSSDGTSLENSIESHVVLLGDSRGLVRVLVVDVDQLLRNSARLSQVTCSSGENLHSLKKGAVEIEEFMPSDHPVLCSDIVVCQYGLGELHFAIIGDTTGRVYIWLLKTSTDSNNSREVASYQMHTMGTNSVSCKLESVSRSAESSVLSSEWILNISSGGDDQAIGMAAYAISISSEADIVEGSTGSSHVDVAQLRACCIKGASGSAIKGVSLFEHRDCYPICVASVGYDQRLALWGYDPGMVDSNGSETTMICDAKDDHCPLRWLHGDVLNIGDVNSISQSDVSQPIEGHHSSVYISAVGEGFQLFKVQ